MTLKTFLHLTPLQVGTFNVKQTAIARLEPRIAVGGPLAGHGFLPLATLTDPDQEDNHLALWMLEQRAIDVDLAWPEEA